MSANHSVTVWIDRLKQGQPEAARRLWERYFRQLVEMARQQLPRRVCRAADEEDVALSAFDSFCRAAAAGRFPDLADRDNLWRLLFALTERKAIDLHKHETRQKRGGGRVVDATALRGTGADDTPVLDAVASREPSPSFAVELAEELERQLAGLDSDEQRQIALLKLEGYTIAEIAGRLGCPTRRVDRRLQLIRALWRLEVPDA